jgi:hypothetical protein
LPHHERISDSRRGKGERGTWQRCYWEHTLRNERDFARHVDYIHFNPVKHGHVSRVTDWPYSSFHRIVKSGVYPGDWAGIANETTGDFRKMMGFASLNPCYQSLRVLHGFCTVHCWCSKPVVCRVGLRSTRLPDDLVFAFAASATLSEMGKTTLAAVRPPAATAIATIDVRNVRMVEDPQGCRSRAGRPRVENIVKTFSWYALYVGLLAFIGGEGTA